MVVSVLLANWALGQGDDRMTWGDVAFFLLAPMVAFVIAKAWPTIRRDALALACVASGPTAAVAGVHFSTGDFNDQPGIVRFEMFLFSFALVVVLGVVIPCAAELVERSLHRRSPASRETS